MKKFILLTVLILITALIIGKYWFSVNVPLDFFAPDIKLTTEEREEGYKNILEKKFQSINQFWAYIPLIFNEGLEWDDVIQRENDVDFRIIMTRGGEEKISVVDGYRILYKYPNTKWFVKVHVEKSKKEEYENDKIKIVKSLMQWSGETIEISPINYNGYEYYYVGNDDLVESPIGMAVIFFPKNKIITTIYFLNQESGDRKFQTIEEYKQLKDNFIMSIIDYRIQYKY